MLMKICRRESHFRLNFRLNVCWTASAAKYGSLRRAVGDSCHV